MPSPGEASVCLGAGRDATREWCVQRRMLDHKVGKLWKFRKEEVDRWVVSGKAGGRSVND